MMRRAGSYTWWTSSVHPPRPSASASQGPMVELHELDKVPSRRAGLPTIGMPEADANAFGITTGSTYVASYTNPRWTVTGCEPWSSRPYASLPSHWNVVLRLTPGAKVEGNVRPPTATLSSMRLRF